MNCTESTQYVDRSDFTPPDVDKQILRTSPDAFGRGVSTVIESSGRAIVHAFADAERTSKDEGRANTPPAPRSVNMRRNSQASSIDRLFWASMTSNHEFPRVRKASPCPSGPGN